MKLVAWGFALAILGAAAESPKEFRHAMPLLPSGEEGLQRVELPLEAYRGAMRSDLADIRLFDSRGERLPFAFAGEPASTRPAVVATSLPLFPLRGPAGTTAGDIDLKITRNAAGAIVELRSGASARPGEAPVVAWIADATGLRDPVGALQFSWAPPAEGFVARMRVEASEDLGTWRTVVSDTALAELAHEGARVKRDTVEVPALRAKYLRFTWSGQAPPLAAVLGQSVAGEGERRLQTMMLDGAATGRPGEVEFAPGARVPVERVRILLPQANSVVPIRLESRDDPKSEWRPVASATVYRLRRDGAEVASPPVAFLPRRDRHWRIVADERAGGFGAGPVRLEVAWLPQQLVFAARGEGPFLLAFGNDRAKSVALPVTTLMPGYRAHDEFALRAAGIGTLQENPGTGVSRWPEWIRDADGKQIALWALLVAGVAVLAVMAWRLSRQVQSPPRGPGPPEGR
ncbi:MAG: DUF3999 domain-containing protein [Betaproteobacteria bacterium]|nr:DUF3999 domain-containing protein [Betaproteobacteria bacterium]PWB59985.1 MAG: hypothetical protein C3F16_11250 [Betaproteobacteria bacterium]